MGWAWMRVRARALKRASSAGGGGVAEVVVLEQGFGGGVLGGGVEGAGGEVGDLEVVPVIGPVGGLGGGVLDGEGAVPALEAEGDALAGVVGVAGGERLEEVEGALVAEGPGEKWEEGEEGDDEGRGQRL